VPLRSHLITLMGKDKLVNALQINGKDRQMRLEREQAATATLYIRTI